MDPGLLSIGIGIGSALIAAGVTHFTQRRKAAVFPSLPSRVETVDSDAAVVRFFAAGHDIVNTITSAWNHARATREDDTMLRELERPVLGQHIDVFQASLSELLPQLTDHGKLAEELAPVCERIDASWSYDRYDQYRTEVYFTTDGKGRRQMRTRQVYSHTNHKFSFHGGSADAAEETIRTVLAANDESKLYAAPTAYLEVEPSEDDRIRVWETILEGGDEKPTDEKVFEAVDAWNEAAIAQHNIAVARNGFGMLRQDATTGRFRIIRSSRKNYDYVSYGGPGDTHDGPKGYQASQLLLSHAKAARQAMVDLFAAVEVSRKHVTEIQELWKAEKRFSELDSDDVARDLLNHGIELYEHLFPKSMIKYDQRMKHGWTIGIGLGTGIIAGLISFAIQMI